MAGKGGTESSRDLNAISCNPDSKKWETWLTETHLLLPAIDTLYRTAGLKNTHRLQNDWWESLVALGEVDSKDMAPSLKECCNLHQSHSVIQHVHHW